MAISLNRSFKKFDKMRKLKDKVGYLNVMTLIFYL